MFGRGHRTRDQLGDAEVRALEDEERAQGDQEAGDAGAHHHVAVEEPDRQTEDQRQDGADDQVDAEVVAEEGVEQARGGDDHTGGQVELATDHQHAHADRDDPDRGRLIQHGEERLRRPERRRDDQEEDEDDDRGDSGADLRTRQQPVRQAELHPVRRLRRRTGRRRFQCLTHENSCVLRDGGRVPARAGPAPRQPLAGVVLGERKDLVDVAGVDERGTGQHRPCRHRCRCRS